MELRIRMSCPLAIEVLGGSNFDEGVWVMQYSSVLDWPSNALKWLNRLGMDQSGEFLAVALECWNTRNRFIFGSKTTTYPHWVHVLSGSFRAVKRFDRSLKKDYDSG